MNAVGNAACDYVRWDCVEERRFSAAEAWSVNGALAPVVLA
jgi:hypothetical protein